MASTPRTHDPHEDKRRPKALTPYLLLWACLAGCVIFALFAVFLQG